MARRLSTQSPGLRRGRWLLLVFGVVLVHVGVVDEVASTVAGWSAEAAMPPRLQVAYVREMAAVDPPPATRPVPPAAPTPAPQPVPTRTQPVVAAAAEEPASAAPVPEPVASVPEPVEVAMAAAEAPAAASAPTLTEPVASAAAPEAAASAASPEAAASAPAFRWPASTRLSYRLTGQYRGEVHGQAQVEWILDAPRYQVNLDVQVGMPIAPLFSRQMRSDGVLSAAGLHPRRYDEDNKMAFRDRRRLSLQLDEDGVTLANGVRWTRSSPGKTAVAPAGRLPPDGPVQDSASQFVQLSYLFTTEPERLQVGRQITLALALPRRVVPWVYVVVAEETLYTPFGAVQTFHVRPHPDTPRERDLLAEAWFAPRWGYLPVRIRIEQDAEVFVDLLIERKPELAAP